MKILVIGNKEVIVKNLILLGAEVIITESAVVIDKDIDGIIITKYLSTDKLDRLKNYNIPIIISGNLKYLYHDIDILVFNEKEADVFLSRILDKPKDLNTCKKILKNLKIKYLVISFGKEKIEKYIKQNLPIIKATEVNVTKETVDKAKEVITAFVAYIYIKTKNLSTISVKEANIKAALISAKSNNLENIKDYYLQIKSKEGEK